VKIQRAKDFQYEGAKGKVLEFNLEVSGFRSQVMRCGNREELELADGQRRAISC
jgi:hypothetical protein